MGGGTKSQTEKGRAVCECGPSPERKGREDLGRHVRKMHARVAGEGVARLPRWSGGGGRLRLRLAPGT